MKKQPEFVATFSNQAFLPAERINEGYEALLNVLIRIFNEEIIPNETV